jgi:peroxiredoxin
MAKAARPSGKLRATSCTLLFSAALAPPNSCKKAVRHNGGCELAYNHAVVTAKDCHVATEKKSQPHAQPPTREQKKHEEQLLDEALQETFPASDPLPVDPGAEKVRDVPAIAATGSPAPDFALKATPDQTVSLDQLKGKPIVLVFYPADWSPVCGDQVSLYNEMLSEFEEYRAQIVGISVDGPWCHVAFAKDRKLRFPLLSDFEPKGEVARRYGIYDAKSGVSQRALFVIDADGIVRWKYVSPIGINPGAEGILDALDQFAKKVGP